MYATSVRADDRALSLYSSNICKYFGKYSRFLDYVDEENGTKKVSVCKLYATILGPGALSLNFSNISQIFLGH